MPVMQLVENDGDKILRLITHIHDCRYMSEWLEKNKWLENVLSHKRLLLWPLLCHQALNLL